MTADESNATDLESDIGKSRLTVGNPALADPVISHVDPVALTQDMTHADFHRRLSKA